MASLERMGSVLNGISVRFEPAMINDPEESRHAAVRHPEIVRELARALATDIRNEHFAIVMREGVFDG